MKKTRLFYSYSHKNKAFRSELEKWLATLEADGLIDEWHDGDIPAGGNLNAEIDANLEKADIVLLLMSQEYLSSAACQKEMNYALENQHKKIIVPIILKTCAWLSTKSADLKALPEDGKPINNWERQEEAWLDVFEGIKKRIASEQNNIEIKDDFLEKAQRIEFVKGEKRNTTLSDIFIFPRLVKDEGDYSKNISESVLDEGYFLKSGNSIIVKGKEFSGKTALLKWLFLQFSNEYYPIFLDGTQIFKTRNFDDHLEKVFYDQMNGNFGKWMAKDNKVAIVDNYHHEISSNLIDYLEKNFVTTIIGINDDEYMVYYMDDPLLVEYTVVSLKQFSHVKQEDLIRKWLHLTNGANKNTVSNDLLIDQIEEKVNKVITTNRIVPRYPFYILSILQTLETFMPKDLNITSYAHCYHALVTAQLLKKNIGENNIDDSLNYFQELAYNIFLETQHGETYTKSDYDKFRAEYKSKYPILNSVLNRIENTNYPIIDFKNEHVSFEYAYIYFFFLSMYLANNIDNKFVSETVTNLIKNIHYNENALIVIFTVHHAKKKDMKDLTETILVNSIFPFDRVSPAKLTLNETEFMYELLAKLPESITSNEDVTENRQALRAQRDQEENDLLPNNKTQTVPDEEKDDTIHIELNKGMKYMEVLGQILKNKFGSYEIPKGMEILETNIDLGLRILNLFLGELQKDEFHTWLEKRLEEAEEHERFTPQEKHAFIQQTMRFVAHSITIIMLDKTATSFSNEKMLEATSTLASHKDTPAYKLIDFLVSLSQNGIDADELKKLTTRFKKNKNYWAQTALSFYVQKYLNTHRVPHNTRQKAYAHLGIEYTPNKTLNSPK